ncbi:MAG: stalk domain-containing protein, partial [Clostridia bacterium]|nr:stalk domain-containing protein [Clostridia bacterium]
MKKFKLIFITLLITLLMCTGAFAETIKSVKLNLTYDGKTVEYRAKEVHVFVDGTELTDLDMPAVIIEDRTLVPLRAIFEAMGAKVSWDSKLQKITAEFDTKTIIMFINNKAGTVNGNAFNMDVAPKIINDRTMVPVRAIAEAVGATVSWDDASRTVDIRSYVIGGDDTSQPEVPQKPTEPEKPADNNTSNESDPQKVTDLSHVDTSEIDVEAVTNSSNEVRVTDIVSNGNDSYTIKTSGKIWQYKYATVLKTKVAVDIYGGSIAVSSTNIPVNDEPVERIRVAQNAIEPYKIVRVVFDLTGEAGDYTVSKSADGTSLVVNFGKGGSTPIVPTEPDNNDNPVIGEDGNTPELPEEFDDGLNGINLIRLSSDDSSDTVMIYGESELDSSVFTLSNPYRIVVDISTASKEINSLPDLSYANFVKNIRVSQFTEKSVRVVIDLKDGVEYSSSNGINSIKIKITKPPVSVSESLINDGKTIRFTKTSGLKASDIT